MRLYKRTENGYILAVGAGSGGEDINETEYERIIDAIAAKPAAFGNTDYLLREDLTWEAYEIEPPEPEPEEIDEAEALSIILGGAT